MLPNVLYGGKEPKINWDAPEGAEDDKELEETPEDVVELLGFDPLEEAREAQASDARETKQDYARRMARKDKWDSELKQLLAKPRNDLSMRDLDRIEELASLLEYTEADKYWHSFDARAQDADGQGPEVQVAGLTCVIETPRGYVRHGKDFEIKLPYDYGYIRGVPGADGDSLDVCIGPEGNGWVYVIDQRHLDRPGFDEHKVFINWPSAKAAVAAFNAGHHRAKDVFMDWTPIPLSEFKHWLKTHDIRKPAGSVKK